MTSLSACYRLGLGVISKEPQVTSPGSLDEFGDVPDGLGMVCVLSNARCCIPFPPLSCPHEIVGIGESSEFPDG